MIMVARFAKFSRAADSPIRRRRLNQIPARVLNVIDGPRDQRFAALVELVIFQAARNC
jgi:hypothetical protein